MRVRDFFITVQNHRKMERVPRTPDSTLAVDEALHSFLQDFPSGIESAERLFIALGNFQISRGIAFGHDREERPAGEFHHFSTVRAALSASDFLKLVVQNLDFGS